MFVSIRRYAIGAGSIDALAHRLEEQFVPAISQEPGFRGYLAIDTGDGTLETVSVFADAESARRSDDLAAEYVAEHLDDFEPTRTGTTGGRILVGRMTPALYEVTHRWRSERTRGRGAPAGRPILVAGATGRTGRQIVARLLEHGVPVRALARDEARARAVLPWNATVAAGDVRRAESLPEAMAGVGTLVIATCGYADPENSAVLVDYFGTRNLVKEAVTAGVGLVVFVSSIYASRSDHYLDVEPTSLGWKARAEEVVRESGVPYCIVRAGWLTDTTDAAGLRLSQGDTGEGHLSRAALADVCARVVFLEEARGVTFEVVAGDDVDPDALDTAIADLTPDDVPSGARQPA